MTYATEAEIEAILGYTIDEIGTSRPSTTQLAEMLSQADSIINAEARVNTNKGRRRESHGQSRKGSGALTE